MQQQHKIIVAIDGYSGTGKSSTAKAVAKRLGYRYIDSGAMYRAVTFQVMSAGIDLNDSKTLESMLDKLSLDFELDTEGGSEIILHGQSVEDQIRTTKVNEHVSAVAAIPRVRKKLVDIQQSFGQKKGIVMDGRDIGTVVFPNAELKVFMTADVKIRAERRMIEMENKGMNVELTEVENNLTERDLKDTTRADSPLVKAEGAFELDTTNLSFQDQVNKIVERAELLIHS